MLNAVSAEAVRIHNGSNHFLRFALIRSLPATGSRLHYAISYAYSATYTKRPAEHSTARAYWGAKGLL